MDLEGQSIECWRRGCAERDTIDSDSSTVEEEEENVGKGRWSRGLTRVELKNFSVCQTRVHFVCRVKQKHNLWLQDNGE